MVTVRPATHKDMGFLVRVLLLANIEKCQKQKGWNAEESLESVRFSTTDELQGRTQDSTTYVIAADGEDVGRLRVVRTGSHLLIAGIQILPDHQRKYRRYGDPVAAARGSGSASPSDVRGGAGQYECQAALSPRGICRDRGKGRPILHDRIHWCAKHGDR